MQAPASGAVSQAAPAVSMSVPEPAPTPEPTMQIESLADFIDALPDRLISLKYDVEKYVRLIRFRQGSMTIENLVDAPPSLVGRMVEALNDMTGNLWLIDQEAGPGAPSVAEKRRAEKEAQEARDRAHPAFNHALLSNAKLIEIRDVDPKSSADSNVIAADFGARSQEQEET